MFIKIFFASIMLPFFSQDLHQCKKRNKVTVVGTALIMKNNAYVLADDGHLYFLDGFDTWDDKYYEKRVKVTGRLVIVEYPIKRKIKNDSMSMIPQRRLGTWRMLKKPKWSLVE